MSRPGHIPPGQIAERLTLRAPVTEFERGSRVLARGEDIVPLVGARRRDRLNEALGALDVNLTADDLAQIEQAIQPDAVAGERYDPNVLALLDSERK